MIKPNLTMGDSNPDTIKRLLGHPTPSFKGLEPLKVEVKEPVKVELGEHPIHKPETVEVPVHGVSDPIKAEMPIDAEAAATSPSMASVEKDQKMKMDIHKNDTKYSDIEQRELDAYSFIENSIEDAYSEVETEDEYAMGLAQKGGAVVGGASGAGSGAVAGAAINSARRMILNKRKGEKLTKGLGKSALKGAGAGAVVGGVAGGATGGAVGRKIDKFSEETNTLEDNYAAGDGVVKAINKVKYGASNIGGAFWGKRKFANKVDSDKRKASLIKTASNMIAERKGLDKDLTNQAATAVVGGVEKGAKMASNAGNKAMAYLKNKKK
jgi:hypothetical protein